MKKSIFVFCIILFTYGSYAQLNEYAEYLIEYHNVDFEITIKKYIIEEYGADHPMATVEINDQSKSIFTIADIFDYKYKEVLFNAIIVGSYKGYETKNKGIFENLKQITLPDLLKLHCNWTDVLYEYNKSVKSKD